MVVLLPFQSGIKLFKRCYHRIAQGLKFGESILDRSEEHGFLLRWMRQLGYPAELTTRRSTFGGNNSLMAKKQTTTTKAEESFEILQLKKRISELENQLKDAEMKAIAFSTMVDIAEKEFNIPIRKKLNTKPLKK